MIAQSARILAFCLLMILALPASSAAEFIEFGARQFGQPSNRDPVQLTPGVPTAVTLYFDTDNVVHSTFDAGVHGWVVDLDATGDVTFGNLRNSDIPPSSVSIGTGPNGEDEYTFDVNDEGLDDLEFLVSCRAAILGATTSCRALDGTRFQIVGLVGTEIPMFTIDVLGTSGSLVATAAEFLNDDFSTTQVLGTVLAIVPEPGSALLVGLGLIGIAVVRRNRGE